MPHRVWTHRCSEDDNGRTLNKPVCERCGGDGTFAGWSYGMYEAMGRYQTFYRLKPVGPHRPMADELFRDLSVPCEACDGRGLLDHPRGCACCPSCRGLARQLTVPEEVVESLRARVLEEYPDAGAEPVEHFPFGVVIHDLARGVIIGAPREEPGRGADGGRDGDEDGQGSDEGSPGRSPTPEPERAKPQLLGPVNELVGRWRIGYADEDGLIGDDGGELVLRPDGTFAWTPEPDWIAGSGAWGVEIEPNGAPKLHLDTDDGRHSHFLVLQRWPDLGTFFHWQRTRADAVIFKDRVLRGLLVEGDGTEVDR